MDQQKGVLMLILGRKINERIKVGDVEITIVGRRGNWIHIGIDAPREVPIERLGPKPNQKESDHEN